MGASHIWRAIEDTSAGHPPYLACSIALPNSTGWLIIRHSNLESSTWLVILRFGKSNPPSCLGLHIFSHVIVWCLRCPFSSPQKNYLQSLSSCPTTILGTTVVCMAYTGRHRVEERSTVRAAFDKNLIFHPPNRFSVLSIRY